jgi:hypothetical protein
MRKFFCLFILFYFNILTAKTHTYTEEPTGLCGTAQMTEVDVQSEINRLSPDQYNALQRQSKIMADFNATMVQQKIFWAYNFKTQQHYQITATLRKTGNITRIWVADASWDSLYVNDNVLNTLLANLENYSGSTSIDPAKGIVEIDTMLFGQPPNYDGDGIVDFLVVNILDDFDPDQNTSFIAGYFSPTDQTNLPYSNKMDLMYLDSYPGIFYNDNYRTEPVLSTTAHEFQHLIHYHYDQNEALWVNEGLSELAGTYCGYGLDFPSLYLDDTNNSLISWTGEVIDYARANLWTLYCAEQLGLIFIKILTQNPLKGTQGFNDSITLSGNPGDLDVIFGNWILANLINNRAVDPRYGYVYQGAAGLHVSDSKLIYQYPETVAGFIENYAVEYHRFRGQDSLEISFSSVLPYNYWIVSKDNLFFVNEINNSDFNVPSFSEDSSYVIALYSKSQQQAYSYDAFALYSLQYYDIVYDDNKTDIKVSFAQQNLPALPANRFTVPESNLSLESVSFWSGSDNSAVNIRILNSGSGQLPGNDLITPLEVFPASANAWVNVELPLPVSGLNKNQSVYVAIQIDDTSMSLGYDNTVVPGISYLKLGRNQWLPLSSYNFGSSSATGIWMIRAAFSGLTFSDSILPPPGVEPLIVMNNFPNPFWSNNPNNLPNGTNFAFQVVNPGNISVQIYGILGQKITEFSRQVSPGSAGTSYLTLHWDGSGRNGPLAAGMYFYRLIYHDAITGKLVRSKFQKLLILN